MLLESPSIKKQRWIDVQQVAKGVLPDKPARTYLASVKLRRNRRE